MAKRLEYIDAMRGLAMLMVVSQHVTLFGFCLRGNPFVDNINILLQIPLFFFVSGYVSDISFKDYSFVNSIVRLWHKVPALIVAPVLFGTLYCLMYDHPFTELLFSMYRAGYWFTIVLFEFLIIYYAVWHVIKMSNVSFRTQTILLVISAIIMLAIWLSISTYDFNNRAIGFFGLRHLRSYIYFVIGVLCHRYSVRMDELAGKTKQMLAILFMLVLLVLLFRGVSVFCDSVASLNYIILASCGVMLIFAAFQKYELAITNSVLGKWLILIGRRTLDVYFMHYFFLPYNMHIVGQWLQANINPLFVYVLAIALSAIPIIAALLVGSLLRMFPLTAALLGSKPGKQVCLFQ